MTNITSPLATYHAEHFGGSAVHTNFNYALVAADRLDEPTVILSVTVRGMTGYVVLTASDLTKMAGEAVMTRSALRIA